MSNPDRAELAGVLVPLAFGHAGQIVESVERSHLFEQPPRISLPHLCPSKAETRETHCCVSIWCVLSRA